jgi:hypothetical protein
LDAGLENGSVVDLRNLPASIQTPIQS